jgi:sortase A
VFPNVDPGNPDEFKPVLQQGVAHAKGTVFPGMVGNTYLFAHSADNWWDVGRYNAVFYLLKNLQKGDEVIVFFEDQRYDYVVSESFIAESSDVSLLNNHKTTEQLVLQTCWPPGTTLKRQFVVAVPKQNSH